MRVKIINETTASFPKISFQAIKDIALGRSYRLNFIIVPPARIKRLNLVYRDKDHATDILSFPLSKNEGEIYLCQSEARKKSKEFGMTYEEYFQKLFIHGCAHLKGYDHGRKMEMFETKILNKSKWRATRSPA